MTSIQIYPLMTTDGSREPAANCAFAIQRWLVPRGDGQWVDLWQWGVKSMRAGDQTLGFVGVKFGVFSPISWIFWTFF